METTETHTILVEESTGTIEYELVLSDAPDDRPIECIGGINLNTGEEVEPLPFPKLMKKILGRIK